MQWSYLSDPYEVDPNHIESVVVQDGDGTEDRCSAMYILVARRDDGQRALTIAGTLTTWHDHTNLCWEGLRVVGTAGQRRLCAGRRSP